MLVLYLQTKPLTLYYIVFDKTRLSLELPDPSEGPIVTTQRATKKRAPRKRNTTAKSPNGLVKSRSFKPPKTPKPRVAKPKVPKKKTVATGGGQSVGIPDVVDVHVMDKSVENGECSLKEGASAMDSVQEGAGDEVAADTKENKPSGNDNVIDLSTDHEMDDTTNCDTASKQDGDTLGTTEDKHMDIDGTDRAVDNIHDGSSENDKFDTVMDTVADENRPSDSSPSASHISEDISLSNTAVPKPLSEDEQPLSVVKIKLKSPSQGENSQGDVTAKAKRKRASKGDKSRPSTKKSKSPKHRKKSDKNVKEYEIVICMDTSSEERALESGSRGANNNSSMPSSKAELVDLTQSEDLVNSKDLKCQSESDRTDIIDLDKSGNVVDSKCSIDKQEDMVNGKDNGHDTLACYTKDSDRSDNVTSDIETTRLSAEHNPVSPSTDLEVIKVSQGLSPKPDTEERITPVASPVAAITDIADKSLSPSTPQGIGGEDNCQDIHMLDKSDKDMDMVDYHQPKSVDSCDRDHLNNLVNQPDLVRSAVPPIECKCAKSVESSRSPSWGENKHANGDGPGISGSTNGSAAGQTTLELVTCDDKSPPVSRSESHVEALSPGINSRDMMRQRASPASSICSVSSSATTGQYDVSMEDGLSSPGSQASIMDRECTSAANAAGVPRHRKISTNRDKAKSINSIIKQIEERKSKKGDVTVTKTSLPSNTQAETVVVKSKSPPVLVMPHVSRTASDYTIAQPIRHSSVSPNTDPGLAQGPVKSQTKRRHLSATRTSPDATPMKRLKQLCNDFDDVPASTPQPSRRNRPPSTPSTSASMTPGTQMFYPPFPRGSNMTMDQRAMMQAVQMGQLHHMQQQAAQLQQQKQQQQQQKQQQQQQKRQQNAQKRTIARNHGVSGITKSPLSPRGLQTRPPLLQAYGAKRPDMVVPGRGGNMRAQFRPESLNTNSAALNSSKKMARPGTPLRPAHTGPNPYAVDYSVSNPLANGYDEPLELTTKQSRDRKVAEDGPHHRPQGTFLKIPTLMKP